MDFVEIATRMHRGAILAAGGGIPTTRMPQPDPDAGPRPVASLPETCACPSRVETGTFQLRAISDFHLTGCVCAPLRPSAPVLLARRSLYTSDWQPPLVRCAPGANRFPLNGAAIFHRPYPKNTSRPRAARKRPFPPLTLSRRFRHVPMLPRAKWLVFSAPIGCSGTRLGTEMDRDAHKMRPLHPTQQSWLPRGAWDFRRTLGVVRYDFLPKE